MKGEYVFKRVTVASLKVPFRHSPEETEKNHKNFRMDVKYIEKWIRHLSQTNLDIHRYPNGSILNLDYISCFSHVWCLSLPI
jgi:hypothetical protein